MLPVKAVCFDLGGVLIQIHHEWEGAMRAAGIEPRPLGQLGGFEQFERFQSGEIGEDEFLSVLSGFLGVESSRAAHAVHMAILRDAYPGVTELASELVARGVVCGCLSNTNASHWEQFFEGRYPFGKYLSVRIGSHIVKASKPSLDIYRAFEQQAQAAGQEIAYFDDGEQNVAAARSLGWQAWLIDPARDTAEQMRRALDL